MSTTPEEIIFDWNRQEEETPWSRPVLLHDETLRDGLQSPSVQDPPLQVKRRILRKLDELGVDSADVGLPASGNRTAKEAEHLVRQIAEEKLSIRPTLAARTHPGDIAPCIDILQRTGVPVEAMMFLGTSPIRLYTEGWDEALLEKRTRTAMKMAVDGGLKASFVTEDTIRSRPETLRRLFSAAIEEGATGLVLCDTVGHATPAGVRSLIAFTLNLLDELGVRDTVRVDWHGHNDRGLALINALTALKAGAHCAHGTMLGIGERVGNTALEELLVNIRLMRWDSRELSSLYELGTLVAQATQTEIPPGHPILGEDAFRTATGVHASAVIKAAKTGDLHLLDTIYSGVPAAWVGREQRIVIGYMSGASNVRWWLDQRGIDPTPERVQAVLSRAKATTRLLTDDEILHAVSSA